MSDIQKYAPPEKKATQEAKKPDEIISPQKERVTYREVRNDRPRSRGGCSECGFRLAQMILIPILMVVACLALFLAGGVLTLKEISDAVSGFSIFGIEQETNIDISKVILAIQQEAFLETYREELQVNATYSERTRLNSVFGFAGQVVSVERRLDYEAYVDVTAGVDLEVMDQTYFQAEGTSITITLPPAQLKDCILDERKSEFKNRSCLYLGCNSFEDKLRLQVIDNAVLHEDRDRILAEAYQNAEEWLINFVKPFGYEDVTIVQSDTELPPVYQHGTCPVPPDDESN